MYPDFFVMHLVPGGPFQQKKLSDVTREALNARYHLDQPLFTQYLLYMKGLLRGDLGVSINDGRLITDILKESFPISCKLGLSAVVLALILGTVFGSVAALRKDKLLDKIILFFSTLLTAIPSFNSLSIFESIQQDFSVLGITSTISSQDFSMYYTERDKGTIRLSLSGWLADFDDPISMLEIMATSSYYNDGCFGR